MKHQSHNTGERASEYPNVGSRKHDGSASDDASSSPRRQPMSVWSLLLNLLWIAFGGLYMAAGWVLAAVIMAITVIGLPWARAAFNIAVYTLFPFGQKAVSRA